MSAAHSVLLPAVPIASMTRRGPKKTQLGTYIPTELHEKLQAHSDASGVPITRIVEDALRAYLARVRATEEPSTGGEP
jgi:hypothetical protein